MALTLGMMYRQGVPQMAKRKMQKADRATLLRVWRATSPSLRLGLHIYGQYSYGLYSYSRHCLRYDSQNKKKVCVANARRSGTPLSAAITEDSNVQATTAALAIVPKHSSPLRFRAAPFIALC